MSKKRGCLISGGGSYVSIGAGTLSSLNKEYDTVIGISAGALIAPFVLLNDWAYLKHIVTTTKRSDIFDKKWYKPYPLTKKGKINILNVIITVLLNEKTLGTNNNLINYIKLIFTMDMYKRIKSEGKEFIVGVQNFNQTPSKVFYFSSINNSYEDMVRYMVYSSSYPIVTTLHSKIWVDEYGYHHRGLWGDGGVSDLIGLSYIKIREYDEFDVILHRKKIVIDYDLDQIKNLMGTVRKIIDVMRFDIEKNSLDKIINQLKIVSKVNVYWLPDFSDKSFFYFGNETMENWWELGYSTAHDEERIDRY